MPALRPDAPACSQPTLELPRHPGWPWRPGNRMLPPPLTPKRVLHHPASLHHQLLIQSPRWVHLIGAPLLLMQSPKLCWVDMGNCWHRSRG